MTLEHSSLGKHTAYIDQYDPTQLFPIARHHSREAIGIDIHTPLPFFGVDLWNAYELSWLNLRGKPQVAIASFYIPAESPNLIESKSFKLYLGSFAQTPVESLDALRDILKRDVSAVCGANASVHLTAPDQFATLGIKPLGGLSLDRLDIDTACYHPDASLLNTVLNTVPNTAPVEETVYSNLLKSNCPVTGQPDWASVQIHYMGPQIDHAALLRYIISYRNHTGFHEQCVEQIFVDILRVCQPTQLTVYARYTRRGGLDINPFRTNHTQSMPDNVRTTRQ